MGASITRTKLVGGFTMTPTIKVPLSELTNAELLKVFEANEGLRYDILSEFSESEMHHVEERLDVIKDGIWDWEIGAGGRSFIEPNGRKLNVFLQGALTLQDDYSLFYDSSNIEARTTSALTRFQNMYGILEDGEDNECQYQENGESVRVTDELVYDAAVRVAGLITSTLVQILDDAHRDETLKEYFLYFYASERLDQDCYILMDKHGGSTYVLYEDITYTKSYTNPTF